jgi:hypothetical protein
LILTAIEERVAEKNKANTERIYISNTVSADKVFAWRILVSFIIPRPIYLARELRKVFCCIV